MSPAPSFLFQNHELTEILEAYSSRENTKSTQFSAFIWFCLGAVKSLLSLQSGDIFALYEFPWADWLITLRLGLTLCMM